MPRSASPARRAFAHVLLALLVGCSVLLSPRAAFAVGTPTASLDVPPETMIGETLSFTVTFDNTGTTTGYGPYIDLVLPAAGADGAGAATDDGITFNNATYLGQALTPIAPSPLLCTAGTFTHPLTGLATACTIGTQVVVLQLPFGSFTADQPPAVISVNATVSNLADVGTPLTVSARPGFIYGNDPLNNPATDPPISGANTSASTTPTLIRLKKTYIGPEDETATGPNFPRQYLIEVDIASGQTVTNLDLTDILPNNLQFVSLDATTIRGTVTATTAVSTPSLSAPGGTLTRRFASVTGTTALNDATMLFTFYVPRVDAGSAVIIDPATGDDVLSLNQASALGNWTPVDARDPGGTANASSNLPGPEHTLTDKSIAIQKSLTNRTDGSNSPGDVIEYTLNFQVSDFFAFQNVVIADTFSDGQRFDPSFTPTLMVNGNSYTLAGAPIAAANFTVDTSQIGNDTNPATNGSTTVTFRVSNELVTRGQPTGRLIGGCVPTTGTGGPAPDCTGYNDGATTATIVFRTILQETFSDTYPSGDPSVDQGDIFTNNVLIDGAVLNTADLTPTGQGEADTSAAQGSIAVGALSKSIYAVDGVVCATQPCANVRTGPGHNVTYRIRYTLPTSDFEGLRLTDYLPLPIFNATEVTTFNNTASAAAPAAGVAKLGPADTYHLRPGALVPTIATTGPGADNTVTFTYGNYDAPNNVASEIDILFTVTALGTPFADGLFLTNQVHATENATNAGARETDAIVQIQLTEPVLNTRKGVIATNGTGVFAPTTVGPVAFSTPGSGCPRFTGTINSVNLAATPINSNLSGSQSGNRVSFAVVVENTGSGLNGAFDVRIRDTIPAGFTIPAGAPGLNLCVTNGAGVALPFTNLGTGFFDPVGGIELVDPAANTGSLAAGRDANNATVTTGANIVIITYDLQITATAAPGQTLTNTGTVSNYASVEGGSDFTTTDLTDTATVQIATTAQTKSIVATSEGHTSEAGAPRPVTIGEIVRYRLVVQVPESTSTNFQMIDRLPTGLRFLNNSAVRVALVRNGGGMTSSTITPALAGCGGLNVTGNTGAVTPTCPMPDTAISNSPTTNTDTYTSGTDVYFKFGNLTNSDGDADAEFVVIEFNAIMDNSAAGSNDAGETRNNDFVTTINGVQSGSASPAIGLLIVEPSITNVDKVALTTSGDAGDPITFRVTYSNATGANVSTAYETQLLDTLPPGLTLDTASIAVTLSGGATGISNASSGNTINITIATIPPGGGVQVQYTATIQGSASPGQVLTNSAGVLYTSLPGAGGTVVNPTGSNTPDPSGGTYGERNGVSVPSVNDYLDSDTATVTIVSPAPVKSIVTTSAAHTSAVGGTDRVAVGEIVRYRLAVQLPEGTSANFQLRDELPLGMQFLNDGTARAALIANEVGISSSTLADPSLSLIGNEANAGTITPIYVLPDAAISDNTTTNADAYASGSDVFFKLGNLNNNDSDTDLEFVVVEFNALVLNVVGNQSGTLLTNTFSVLIGGTVGATSPGLNVGVAEPLVNVAKSISAPPAGTPVDAGDSVTYNLVVTNMASGSSAAAAFDLSLSDVIDNNLTLQSVNVTKPAYAVVTNATAGNTVAMTIDRLNPGDSVTVTVTVTVNATVQTGITIPNTANVTYTSLPGTNGTTPNPTGSNTPGSSGANTGERNGDDGSAGALNDYAASGAISLALAAPAINKLAPTPTQYTIGETVSYDILVTLPEGTTEGLVLTDDLPDGLTYLSHSLVTTAAASNGRLTADYAGDIASLTATRTSPAAVPGASGENLVLTFPTATTAADNVATNNTFVLRVVARVLNVVGNVEGSTLSNSASLTYTDPATNNPITLTDTPVDITVIEPELTISKTVLSPSASVGDLITFRMVVAHPTGDTETAYDVEVVDTLPAGVTYEAGSARIVAGSPAGTVDASAAPTLRWRFPSIAPGQTATVEFDARINGSANAALPIVNSADVLWTSLPGASPDERTGADGPGGALNDYAARSSAQIQTAAYTLSKTLVSPASGLAPVNGAVRFSIVVTNTGGTTLTTVPVIDSYDTTYLTYVGATPASNDNTDDGTINWSNIGPIPAGESRTILVDFTAKAPTAQTTNTAQTSAVQDQNGTPLPNASSSANVAISQPDLQVSKSDGGVTTTPGGTVAYTLSYTNVGGVPATGVVLSETVPANAVFNAAASTAGWSCADGAPAGTVCTLLVGTVAATANGTATFAVAVNNPLPAGVTQLTNTVAITDNGAAGADPTPANNSASDTTPITAAPDLQVSKSDGGVTTTPGGTVVYTLSYTNVGNIGAIGVVLSETVPANTTFTSGAGTPGWSCADGSAAGTVCTLTVGALAGGASGTVTFAVTVDAPLLAGVTQLTNTVTITDDGANGTDPTPANNSASDATPITAAPDLQISKSDGGATTTPGGTVAYTLSYSNVGNIGATGVVLSETVPANAVFNAAASTAGWSCADGAAAGTVCTLPVGTVAAGGNGTATFAVTVNNPLPAGVTQLTNTVTITDDGANGADPTPANNSASDTTPITAAPDLRISKSDGGATTTPGGTVVYTLSYSNVGNIGATGVVLSETVPANAVFNAAASTAGWSCADGSAAGTVCTLTVGALAGGASGTATFAVTVVTPLPAGVTQLTNTVTITDDGANGADPTPADNSASDTTPITAAPIIGATKAVEEIDTNENGVTDPGDALEYTVVVANTGNQDAAQVIFTDTPDANTTLMVGSVTTTQGSVTTGNTAGDTTVAVDLGTLAGGASATIIFRVTIDEPLPAGVSEVRNQGLVTGGNFVDVPTDDPDTEPRPDPTVTEITAAPDLQISKSDGGVGTTPGGTVVYTLSYSNVGNIGATGVVLSETVPANTTFTSGAGTPGWSCANGSPAGTVCTLSVGALAGGASGTATFAVTVNNPLPAGVTQVANTVTIADDGANGADPTPADNSASDTTPVTSAPDLWVVKSDGGAPVVPGNPINYTLSYGNRGNIGATGVVLSETVPANTTFNQGTSSAGWSCANGSAAGTVCTLPIGALASGATGSVTFSVVVDTPLAPTVSEIANSVSIEDDGANGSDPTPADNTSAVSTPFNPTAIELASLTATHQGNGIMVRWQTTSEIDTYGFDLYRSSDTDRDNAVRITPQTILGLGRNTGGASYEWLDTEIVSGTTYTYWLQETETDSTVLEYEPVTARHRIFFPFVRLNQE